MSLISLRMPDGIPLSVIKVLTSASGAIVVIPLLINFDESISANTFLEFLMFIGVYIFKTTIKTFTNFICRKIIIIIHIFFRLFYSGYVY